MAVSEPKFTIKSKSDKYEIRIYEPTIVVETVVEANFDEAGNKAFRILADFIFGNNVSQTKIDMTAPVTLQPVSEKIEMTVPVSQIKAQGGYIIQFTMPDRFNMETLPKPNDSRVTIRSIPQRTIAVYSYSGSWSEDKYKSKLAEFTSELLKDNVNITGEPVFARFNSPLQFWFLRRNEIWYEVAK